MPTPIKPIRFQAYSSSELAHVCQYFLFRRVAFTVHYGPVSTGNDLFIDVLEPFDILAFDAWLKSNHIRMDRRHS